MKDTVLGEEVGYEDLGFVDEDGAGYDGDLEGLAVESGEAVTVFELGAVVDGSGFLDGWRI